MNPMTPSRLPRSISIPAETYDRIREITATSNSSVQRFVDHAIAAALAKYEKDSGDGQ